MFAEDWSLPRLDLSLLNPVRDSVAGLVDRLSDRRILFADKFVCSGSIESRIEAKRDLKWHGFLLVLREFSLTPFGSVVATELEFCV